MSTPYALHLDSFPNPDFNETVKPAPKKRVPVAGHADAKRAVESYVSDHDLGGGNFANAIVTNEAGGVIGYFSYNGRFWPTIVAATCGASDDFLGIGGAK